MQQELLHNPAQPTLAKTKQQQQQEQRSHQLHHLVLLLLPVAKRQQLTLLLRLTQSELPLQLRMPYSPSLQQQQTIAPPSLPAAAASHPCCHHPKSPSPLNHSVTALTTSLKALTALTVLTAPSLKVLTAGLSPQAGLTAPSLSPRSLSRRCCQSHRSFVHHQVVGTG
jgi:hypothetical protein